MGWTGEYNYKGRKLSYAEEKAKVFAHYESMNEYQPNIDNGLSVRVVHVSNVRPAWYVAVEVTAPAAHATEAAPYDFETLADGQIRYTFAEVMLTRNGTLEWMYKCICEGAGPVEAKAPESFIKKLSPIDSSLPLEAESTYGDGTSAMWPTRAGSALKWREDCATYRANKRKTDSLKYGDVIRLETALLFDVFETGTGNRSPIGRYETLFRRVDATRYGYKATKNAFVRLESESGSLVRLSPSVLRGGFEIVKGAKDA